MTAKQELAKKAGSIKEKDLREQNKRGEEQEKGGIHGKAVESPVRGQPMLRLLRADPLSPLVYISVPSYPQFSLYFICRQKTSLSCRVFSFFQLGH